MEIETSDITSFPAPTKSQFVSLKSLRIQNSPISQDLICAIFTLPNLQSIKFEGFENENPDSLFLSNNYPSSGLSPLQSFSCSNYEGVVFSEEITLAVLQRFPLLQTFEVGMKKIRLSI